MALTPQIRASLARAVGIYNIPAPQIRASFARVNVPAVSPANLHVSQSGVIALYTGRTNSPKLKAWGFTQDGHDFFVLKLGTQRKTLVFDISTDRWSWWSTDDRAAWVPATGLNWASSGSIPQNFGSNVVVGDDTTGTLYVLDPELGVDQDDEGNELPFERRATGYIPVRSRTGYPVYAVELVASYGAPAQAFSTVSLLYSDDQGHSYEDAGAIAVTLGDYAPDFSWRSLGEANMPGRLFQIFDNGAFARIDALYVNPDEKED